MTVNPSNHFHFLYQTPAAAAQARQLESFFKALLSELPIKNSARAAHWRENGVFPSQ